MIRLYTAATPGFLALTPNHQIPVIDDDGLVIWESGAILLHLAEKHAGLLPEDPKDRIAAIQYAFFQTGGIGPRGWPSRSRWSMHTSCRCLWC